MSVSFDSLINGLSQDTWASLAAFGPELCLCATIVLLLLVRMLRITARLDAFYVALVGSAVALWFAAPWQDLDSINEVSPQQIFTGMLIYDPLTIYFRVVLLAFAVLFAIFTRISGIPDRGR